MQIKQKGIYLADLNPVEGSEQAGLRPVVVISGPTMNKYLNLSIVCPLTTKVKKYENCPILAHNKENGLNETSQILTFQVSTVSQGRLKKKVGDIKTSQLKLIWKCLAEFLYY